MEKLFYNGDIITMEAEGEMVEAILIKDGSILAVGLLDEVKKVASEDVIMVDLDGKTLMPSFIDSHGHASMVGQMSSAVDLSECETFEEIVEELIAYKEKSGVTPEGLIMGFGYDHNFLPDEKHPTKEYLNQVSTDIPIYLLHTSAHMGCANDALLTLVNITSDTPNPQGGVIGRVEGTMEPNGYLEEAGMMAAYAVLGERIQFELFTAMEKAQDLYLSNGVTTAQDGAAGKDNVKMFAALAGMNKLKMDIVSYVMIDTNVDALLEENKAFTKDYVNRFRIGGYKAVLDGSPQGKSAWLTKPYENSGDYCAYSWSKDEEVEAMMKKAITDHKQVLVHCNGDAAGDQFLNAYTKAVDESEDPDKMELRPVMIHCQTAREDQLDIMADYKMVPSIFVGHVYYWGDVHLKNLGEERGANVSPVAWALDRGLIVNFHQDTPVTKPKMLHTIWTAVNRMTRGGIISGAHQRCSVYEAMKAVTINAAYGYFEEDSKGSLREGKRADLVILDKNPMRVPSMDIKDIQVLETIKDGECVYSK